MTSKNSGAEARLHLLDQNRDAVAVMLGKAAAGGLDLDDAVVLIMDQQDPVGHELAEAAARKAGLDATDEAHAVTERGEIPTALVVLGLEAARTLFRESHPTVARGLVQHPPHGRVRTVVIAAGAAMLVHAQVSAVRLNV